MLSVVCGQSGPADVHLCMSHTGMHCIADRRRLTCTMTSSLDSYDVTSSGLQRALGNRPDRNCMPGMSSQQPQRHRKCVRPLPSCQFEQHEGGSWRDGRRSLAHSPTHSLTRVNRLDTPPPPPPPALYRRSSRRPATSSFSRLPDFRSASGSPPDMRQ